MTKSTKIINSLEKKLIVNINKFNQASELGKLASKNERSKEIRNQTSHLGPKRVYKELCILFRMQRNIYTNDF